MPLQILTERNDIPEIGTFKNWIKKLYSLSEVKLKNITIRVVEAEESEALNAQFRGKEKPTNVLSFEADLPEITGEKYLGDIVICADIVEKEAREQGKSSEAHWAHMLVHGMLHLRGYDHLHEEDAEKMEALEVVMLAELGFLNPYE